MMCMAAVIVLANGERGDYEKGSEDLIEHVQHIKAKLLIQNTLFMLAYRNIYTDLHRIDSKVDTLSAEVNSMKDEMNGMKDEVNGMKDEMNCKNQLLHKIAMKIQV